MFKYLYTLLMVAIVGVGWATVPASYIYSEVQNGNDCLIVDYATGAASYEISPVSLQDHYTVSTDGYKVVAILPAPIFMEKMEKPVINYRDSFARAGHYQYLDGKKLPPLQKRC